ncbi:MAG: VOC family protein [Actinobacteria bacterium]|nr:VOC family protein [Actinomycetota bacterium]
MATAQIQHITIDCANPQRLAAFWSTVLGREVVDDWGVFVRLAPDDAGTRLAFQLVPEAKSLKNRVHLDLSTDSVGAAVSEFKDLGATVVGTNSEAGITWTTMQDPEGNEFCVAPDH